MRRADRLFQIVQLLRGRRLTTARWLAERLEVSPRTIYRDIADLIGSGVPVEGEAGVGYMLRPGMDLPPLMFDAEELAAIDLGLRFAQAVADSLADDRPRIGAPHIESKLISHRPTIDSEPDSLPMAA